MPDEDDEVSIAVNPAASIKEAKELSESFAEAGINIPIGEVSRKIMESHLPFWEVWIFSPSIDALVGGAAVAGATKLSKLIRSIFHTMRNRDTPGVVSMRVRSESVVAIFTKDLPDLACKKLLTEPIPPHDKSHEIEWDDELQAWRDRLC